MVKITSLAKVSNTLLVLGVGEGDEERIFYVAVPPELFDTFADMVARMIVECRLGMR